MNDRMGRYANLRPERIEQFSVEFKKDLLQGQVSKKFRDRHEERRREKERKYRRRKRAESDSSSSDSDSSGSSSSGSSSSGSSSSGSSRSRRKRRRRRSVSSSGSDSSDQDSEDWGELEDDSDLETNGLNLKRKLYPILFYVTDDRDALRAELKNLESKTSSRKKSFTLHHFVSNPSPTARDFQNHPRQAPQGSVTQSPPPTEGQGPPRPLQ